MIFKTRTFPSRLPSRGSNGPQQSSRYRRIRLNSEPARNPDAPKLTALISSIVTLTTVALANRSSPQECPHRLKQSVPPAAHFSQRPFCSKSCPKLLWFKPNQEPKRIKEGYNLFRRLRKWDQNKPQRYKKQLPLRQTILHWREIWGAKWCNYFNLSLSRIRTPFLSIYLSKRGSLTCSPTLRTTWRPNLKSSTAWSRSN